MEGNPQTGGGGGWNECEGQWVVVAPGLAEFGGSDVVGTSEVMDVEVPLSLKKV